MSLAQSFSPSPRPEIIDHTHDVRPVTDQDHFLSMMLPLETKRGTISDKVLAKKYPELELIYNATVATFNKVLVAQDIRDEDKRYYLPLLKKLLDKLSAYIARTYSSLLSDVHQGQDWEKRNDDVRALDIDELMRCPQLIPQAQSALDRLTAPVVGFGKKLWGLVTSPVETYRSITGDANWWRIFWLRAGDFYSELAKLVDRRHVAKTGSIFSLLSKPFSLLGMFIYTSRFCVNTAMLIKHALGLGIEEEERAFPWYQRLKMQWDARKYEMANDFVWGSVGIATFALLSATVGPIVGAAFYSFDVANAGYQMYEKSKRNNRVLEDIAVKEYSPHTTESDRKIIRIQKESLQHEVSHERRSMGLSVGVSSALLVGVVPTVAAVPAVLHIPIIGTAILAGAMLVEKVCSKIFSWFAPKHDLPVPQKLAEENSKTLSSTSKIQNVFNHAPQNDVSPKYRATNVVTIDHVIENKQAPPPPPRKSITTQKCAELNNAPVPPPRRAR